MKQKNRLVKISFFKNNLIHIILIAVFITFVTGFTITFGFYQNQNTAKAAKGTIIKQYSNTNQGYNELKNEELAVKQYLKETGVIPKLNYVKLDVPYINQKKPLYAPMGCEGASMLMGLMYKGVTNVSYKTFLDNMPKSPDNNPFNGFAGSPYDVKPGIFHSIFPEALTKYSKQYRSSVTNISDSTSDDLKKELAAGNPVVVYVTNRYFETPKLGIFYFGGKSYNIVSNMHVVLLTGFDDRNPNAQTFYITDPNDKGTYWISKEKFNAAYNCLKWAISVR